MAWFSKPEKVGIKEIFDWVKVEESEDPDDMKVLHDQSKGLAVHKRSGYDNAVESIRVYFEVVPDPFDIGEVYQILEAKIVKTTQYNGPTLTVEIIGEGVVWCQLPTGVLPDLMMVIEAFKKDKVIMGLIT